MTSRRILALTSASIALVATAAFCVAPSPKALPVAGPTPAPRPAGGVAPRLDALEAREISGMPEGARRCILRSEGSILMAATEAQRGALVKVGGRVLPLRYQERTPLRNGGRFVAPGDAFDVWVAVNPTEDMRLPKGAPRSVTVMVNDLRRAGSEVSSATWRCNH